MQRRNEGSKLGDEGRKSLRGMEERWKGEENEVDYGGMRWGYGKQGERRKQGRRGGKHGRSERGRNII